MSKLKAKNPKDTKPTKPKIVVFGASGVGKTWAALTFPKPYYIDTEGGATQQHYSKRLRDSGGAYLGIAEGSREFNTVIDQVKLLATEKHDFKTLVVDSASVLFMEYIAIQTEKMMAKGTDMTKTYGAEKKPAISYARQFVSWINKLDMTVILICHEKAEYKDDKLAGYTYDFWDKAEYLVDLALRITKQGQSRKAFVRKTRLENIKDGITFDWSYEDFAKLYGKETMESEVNIVTLATPEQLARVAQLNDILKTTPEEIDKHFIYADATKYSDMSNEKIQFVISRLEAKLPK